MKAMWVVTTVESGFDVRYVNLVDDIVFECGICSPDIPLLWEFMVEEGHPGDFVFHDGKYVGTTPTEMVC
jgi:hypothetical protein